MKSIYLPSPADIREFDDFICSEYLRYGDPKFPSSIFPAIRAIGSMVIFCAVNKRRAAGVPMFRRIAASRSFGKWADRWAVMDSAANVRLAVVVALECVEVRRSSRCDTECFDMHDSYDVLMSDSAVAIVAGHISWGNPMIRRREYRPGVGRFPVGPNGTI
ncbi:MULTISPECIES: hypothetical protein [unclassified Nocardia]|uniref:hypothetical protein n=1 Tax=unclassified Nocardia TaxID=2637762 RepID=UPI001CE4749B|nr:MULTISPECIES: hypothetical protein [unclassified Nocardia]